MASSAPEISVVVPVFNEIEVLPRLKDTLLATLRRQARPFELILVDDGSTDGSSAMLDDYRLAVDEIRIVRLDRNWGLTSALDAGFRAARADVIVSLDADLQNDPDDIPTLLAHIETHDMVCGWRKNRHDPWLKRASSRIANSVRNRFSGEAIHDTCCPLKVLRREVIDSITLYDGLHRFLPTLAREAGFRVIEVPVKHRPRQEGHSKYGVWNRMLKGISDLRAVRWMKKNRMRYQAEILD